MTSADIQALYGGMDSVIDVNLRRQAMKRQLQRDAEEREMRQRALKLAEEEAGERRREQLRSQLEKRQQAIEAMRRETNTLNSQGDQIQQQIAADAWARSPDNPANQERIARAQLAQAQAQAMAQKPATPLGAQLAGLDEFTEAMAAAVAENQAALQAAQAGDPTAQGRAMKAQLKLSTLSEMGKNLMKQAKPSSMVKISRKSEDGGTSEELEVPADQWNEQHPMWRRFNPSAAQPAAGGNVPAPKSKAERDALPPGTMYRGPDGQLYRR